KLGIVGIGVGASEILPAMEQIPEFELIAAADVNPRVLETFRQRYGAKTYDSVEKMCADPDVEAVWVSTPNRFHVPHTIIAAKARPRSTRFACLVAGLCAACVGPPADGSRDARFLATIRVSWNSKTARRLL